jgi:protein-S-isoprenylcysteine O-methyltransferase Ste14
MAMRENELKAILLVANLLFWLLVAARVVVGRARRRAPDGSGRTADGRQTGGEVSSPRAGLALFLVSLTMGTYYVVLTLWWADPVLAGPVLLPSSLPLQMAGIGLMCLGIVLMAWSYAVFGSWRFRAQIEPGHRLIATGPYASVRHPIYLSVKLFYLGSFLLVPRAGFLLQTLSNALAYDFRARIEEELLLRAFGDEYRRYMQRTKRLIPWIY